MTVVVVGAGIAGIACAVELASAGVDVRVVDRGRAVGGRMASKRIDGRPVDIGAAYFTVRDPEFAQVVARWRTAGLARPWTSEMAVFKGTGERSRAPGPVRWAAPGGLRSLVAALAEGLPVELGHKVTRVGPGPTVDGDAADAVVLAMPDPQARRILADTSPATAELDGREWQPVISVAAGWARREWPPMNAAFVNDHPVISLVADDGDRRGDGAPVLVAHSVADVARRHDACPDDAVAPVLEALRRLLNLRSDPVWTHAHRWRYASPAEKRDSTFHLGDDGIGLAGDAWGSPRIETAWRSGTDLARALLKGSRFSS
jgi:predicted NAD/FAD-dependent oxidoreductase